MKLSYHIIPALLAALLAAGCSAAPAKEASTAAPEAAATAEATAEVGTATLVIPTPSMEQDFVEPEGSEQQAIEVQWTELTAASEGTVTAAYDLNGDGSDESISVITDEDAYKTDVKITGMDGALSYSYTIEEYLYDMLVYAGTTDTNTGLTDLYITGDAASYDYDTFLFRVDAAGAVATGMHYGKVTGVDGHGHMTLEEQVDVLGTYYGTRDYRVENGTDGTLTITADGVYNIAAPTDDYQKLTLQEDMTGVAVYSYGASVEDGPAGYEELVASGTADLKAGTVLWLVYTDQESFVVLEDNSGRLYRMEIQLDGLSDMWTVNGNSESHWFGELNYAG